MVEDALIAIIDRVLMYTEILQYKFLNYKFNARSVTYEYNGEHYIPL